MSDPAVPSVPVPDLDTIRDALKSGMWDGAWAKATILQLLDRLEALMPADPTEHPDHPHGSTVEQVHRMFSAAYADADKWMLAEETVRFVSKAALESTCARLVAVEAERDTLRDALERIARPDTWTMQRDRHGQIAWAALNGVSPDGPVCCRCGATDAAQQCPKGMHHQFVLPPSVVPGERERED